MTTAISALLARETLLGFCASRARDVTARRDTFCPRYFLGRFIRFPRWIYDKFLLGNFNPREICPGENICQKY